MLQQAGQNSALVLQPQSRRKDAEVLCSIRVLGTNLILPALLAVLGVKHTKAHQRGFGGEEDCCVALWLRQSSC